MKRRDLLTYAPIAAAGAALGGAAVAEAAAAETSKERIRRLALELRGALDELGETYTFFMYAGSGGGGGCGP